MLVRVEAAGMCRTDFQLINGYFKEALNLSFPAIPGHEIAGSIAEIGGAVPATANLAIGDQVVVVGGWGDAPVGSVARATSRSAGMEHGQALADTEDTVNLSPSPTNTSSVLTRTSG
ncbi:alcohol dehydrogenase catalytic domain-containing protein [Edaphobacter modestus]|uniref:alcohol dehydrogenase catalytic domain-containing protein n=1 Tax=Edaphobacter modestus TaxID=388466 RepID=UPI001A9317C2|nr:alcohol dehydrogenase catalytic domain-containing protein [Edaphobacter modestus]